MISELDAAFDRGREGRSTEGARLRLVLAVAGLAALVAWGALSHVVTEASVDARSATSAQDAPRYDGRGKWTGYTSEWRSRPQILRDAGITQGRRSSLAPARRAGAAPQSTWISQVVR